MHEAGVDRLVLASSMVVYGEGRYACPEHGDQAPPPRARRGPGRRRLREPLPASAAAPLSWALVDEDARLDPRSVLRREQAGPGALRRPPGCGRPTRPRSRCATTTSTARACRGTRRTPGWRRCSAPPSSAARRRRSTRTAARCATSCTSTTSPAPTSPRCAPSWTSPPGRYARLQRRLRAAGRDPRRGPAGRRRAPGRPREPEVTGGYRLGDVRHVVASPERGPRPSSASPPRSPRRRACRQFATAPLRA